MKQVIRYRVCDRCTTPTDADVVDRIAFNGVRYTLDLCARHDQQLSELLEPWLQTATQVGETSLLDRQQPAKVVTVALPRPAGPVEPVETVVLDEPREARADRWTLPAHFHERLAERELLLKDVLATAEAPDWVVPSKHTSGRFVHHRAGLKVVVEPATMTILTASYRDDELAQAN